MSKKLKMPANGLFGLPSSVRQTNNEDILSSQVPENSDTEVSKILKNLDTSDLKNLNTQVLNNSDSEELNHSKSTEVLKNSSIQVLRNVSTEVLEVQGIPVSEGLSTKESGYQGISALPKPQKNNRTKDDKKPARKQASVHLTGGILKALHLYAYEEGLEKSEVVEKALKKFIPKKFFQ